jgi:hypothetical protein
MRRRWCSASAAGLFLLQIVMSGFPAGARPASDWRSYRNDIGASTPLLSERLQLDKQHRRASLAGLEAFLRDDYRGPMPVSVLVECFGHSGTPSLAIDSARYGPEAFLLNVTKLPEHKCSSYQVAIASETAAAADTETVEGMTESIAVSVHYSGLRQAGEKTSTPAVFVFNPVHGNWTEAKPYAPPKQEAQRVYATLSEHHQRIISGVIALPESLQSEPARSQPSSLSEPLAQVSPTDGYLAVDSIEPDHKGAYSVNLPLLLRPSRGPGPSFSIAYNSQGAPGVLGRGWDLSISTIEARGPSPLYHPAYETEDYILDGMDLIALDGEGKDIPPPPLYKGPSSLASRASAYSACATIRAG